MDNHLRRLRRIVSLLAVVNLCLLGAVYAADTGTVYFSNIGGSEVGSYSCPADIYVTLTDTDLSAETEVVVTVTSPSTDSETLTLSSVPGTGPPFRNTTALSTAIDTGSPTPGDGILTTNGQNITVSYWDLSPAGTRTDIVSLTGGSPAITYSVHDAADTATNQINTAYCVDEIIEVGFSNTSPDTAYNVRYEITLPAGYEIDTPSSTLLGAIHSDTAGSYPSYYQAGTTVYFYLYEEMAGSTSDTLTFTFKKKAAPDGCGASLTGTVGFTLFYQNICGGIITSNNSQSLIVADGTFTFSVDKKGATEVVENDIAPFYVSFTYTGPLSCAGNSINVVAVDTLPYILDVADSGNASTVETAIDDDGNTIYVIKWNITIDTSPYDWSDTVYLRGRIGECGKEAYNLFNVFYTDCCGCVHAPGEFAAFFLANKCPPRPEQGRCVSMFEKAALPTNAVESCKPAFFTHEIHFPDTMPATVSWDELTFREQGRRGMVLIGDTADFWVKDCGDT
ncbi:hypothetical protein KKH50_04595, partial [Patescibacteria group bacterium]|nr:hypothetical protein [Patescibacteria group bacterium]